MNTLARWFFTLFGVPLIKWAAERMAAYIKAQQEKAENKRLREQHENALTQEERDAAASAIIKKFNSDSDS